MMTLVCFFFVCFFHLNKVLEKIAQENGVPEYRNSRSGGDVFDPISVLKSTVFIGMGELVKCTCKL